MSSAYCSQRVPWMRRFRSLNGFGKKSRIWSSAIEVRLCRTRASLGVASSDISGLQWQSLVDDSDAALYQAKRLGKNKVVAATPWAGIGTLQRFSGNR